MTVQDWSNAMDIKELQKIMQENGVVGAGGAGLSIAGMKAEIQKKWQP